MLSEINQAEKDKYHMISQVDSKNKQETKLMDTENRLVVTRGGGRGYKISEEGLKVQTSSYKKNVIGM